MKTLLNILPPTRPHWVGDGFNVHPLFADMAFTKRVSPFLMLDYAAPKHFDPTSRKLGVGQHPHRGFETVTIAYQGEVEHGDHLGNHGVIGPGDVQWMTAASGIIHEEFHSRHFAKEGGVLEMVQLWVNLPAQYKMSPPRYQPILRSEIPVVSLPEGAGTVSVIAGEFNGVAGRASTFTPINMWDVRLKAGRTIEMSVPEGHNTIVLVRSGSVLVASDETHGNSTKSLKIGQAQIALFSLEGTGCTLKVIFLLDTTMTQNVKRRTLNLIRLLKPKMPKFCC